MASDGIRMTVESIYIGEIIVSTYVTEKLLAAGKTSTVFIARSKSNQEVNLVALKVQPIGTEQQTLNNDIAVLKSIGGMEYYIT
ncbi:MAG: hypothetical protein EZS28_054824 [Streblomastix strix]|uniref:Protein kinase domain-containing protein n=1 Tax=Streblomastix strix TaxID=222440 RepID=A0A5J4QCI7_9EUKA|nr:MAG: hypothetical protein EZS28_054824 [Streblomastix strix]